MAVRKIGIITCANATRELDCCSMICLNDLGKRIGKFAEYPPEDELRLSGMTSCAGCPTIAYPEKIIRKVKALWQLGIRDIHLSNCMLDLCPFVKKYSEVIQHAFPELNLVLGSHKAHISAEKLRQDCRVLFANNLNMNEVILGKM